MSTLPSQGPAPNGSRRDANVLRNREPPVLDQAQESPRRNRIQTDPVESRSPSPSANDPQHVYVRHQCGVCGFLFCSGDNIVALIRPGSDDQYVTTVNALEFSDAYYSRHEAFSFCRVPRCSGCEEAPESTTIHTDCYNLYMQRAKSPRKKSRLWTLAAWSYPWLRCAPLLLLPELAITRATRHAVANCGLERLATLPPEIVLMIWELSQPAVLLRLCAVLDVVDRLDRAADDAVVSMPLRQVQAWERGSVVPTRSNCVDKSDIFITIDSWGIRRIERLRFSDSSRVASFAGGSTVYTIAKFEQDIDAHFSLGLGRLVMDETAELQIWDIPSRIPIHSGVPNPYYFGLSSARIATVHFASCTGITFFISHGTTFAIHAHNRSMPSAETTFRRLTPQARLTVVWVYLPLPRADTLLAFGLRHGISARQPIFGNYSYLIRTSLMGDFTAGPFYHHHLHTYGYPVSRPSKLLHTVSLFHPVHVLCTHPVGPRPPYFSPVAPKAPTPPPPISGGCYSSAVLKSVARVWVFRDAQTYLLRGLLVVYQNGAQRALGECRLGVDPSERCSALSCLAFASDTVPDDRGRSRYVVRVVVLPSPPSPDDGDSDVDDDTWTSCFEGSLVEIWVTHRDMLLTLSKAEPV